MAKKTPDILERANVELLDFERQADDAVSTVTRTIERLNTVNEKIEEKLVEIADYQNSLEIARVELEESRSRNARIIKNFKALIGEEAKS